MDNQHFHHKLTHCPLCDGSLETLVLHTAAPQSYCPDCNVARFADLREPQLCAMCDAEPKYLVDKETQRGVGLGTNLTRDAIQKCWMCDSVDFYIMSTQKFFQMVEEDSLRWGFHAGRTPVLESEENACDHVMTKERISKHGLLEVECDRCRYREFVIK